jgi:dTDP-4-dehydrorhamnose reductase
MPKALLVGSTGLLGSALSEGLLGVELESSTRAELDLSHPLTSDFKTKFDEAGYDYLILSAAITDVEKCYQDQVLSNAVNVTGTKELLSLSLDCGTLPIFFSSDYVFHGFKRSFAENDWRTPQTVYGKQKLEVETFLENSGRDFLLFRTSKLIALSQHPRNILLQISDRLKRGEVCPSFVDQFFNPCCVEDIGRALEVAIAEEARGKFHLGMNKVTTRHELALEIAERIGADKGLVTPMKIAEVQVSEPRPHCNVLDSSLFQHEIGFRFTELDEALDQFFA